LLSTMNPPLTPYPLRAILPAGSAVYRYDNYDSKDNNLAFAYLLDHCSYFYS
jgi:hypothetical protein